MKIVSYFIVLMMMLGACNVQVKEEKNATDLTKERIKLMEADKAFSDLCEEQGMRKAFIEYIDSNGVLLRPNTMPVVGAHAIDYLIQFNDTGFTMKWQPHYSYVAQSADLGYTYGVYSLTPSSRDTVLYGTYVSIWKKQRDGAWKFVLDSGNEGVGSQ